MNSWIPEFPDEQPNSVPKQVEVSVCLVTYNHAPFIRQALDSVLMQRTNFAFELLVGEDDSEDGTRAICCEYAARFPERIRLFLRRAEDKILINGRKTGRFNARETRRAARGRYLAILEGDDFWIDSEKLQLQFDHMEAHPMQQMCGTRCILWRSSKAVVSPPEREGHFVSYKRILRAGSVPHTSTFFVRNGPETGPPPWGDSLLQRDLTTILHNAQPAGGLAILPRTTSVYRITGGGVWTSQADTSRDVIRFWEVFARHAQSIGDEIGLRAARSNLRYHRLHHRLNPRKSLWRKILFHGLAFAVCPHRQMENAHTFMHRLRDR